MCNRSFYSPFIPLLFRVNLTDIFHNWQSKLNEANTVGCTPGNIGSNGDNKRGCFSVYFPVSFFINHFLVRLTTYLTSFNLPVEGSVMMPHWC